MSSRRTFVVGMVLVGVVLAAGAGLFFGAGNFFGNGSGAGAGSRGARAAADTAGTVAALPVRVTRPEVAAATRALELPAESAPFEEAVLFARVDGYVRDRFVDIGDTVAADQTLAVIDAPELSHQFDQAQAQVRQAEANLRLARVNLDRAEQLTRQGHVSRQVLDEREADVGVREADLAAARADSARLQQLLDFREVTAPFPGIVVSRNVDKGDLVEADAPEPGRYMFRLARIDVLRMFADIPQSAVDTIGVGTPADIRFAEFPEVLLQGDVVRTAGVLDPASRSMRVEVHLPNPQRLPAGMIGRVTFKPPSPAGLLMVPINALITRADGAFVAVVTPASTVRFAPVSVGRNLGSRIEISRGLAADERVIVNPNGLLREGDPVTVEG